MTEQKNDNLDLDAALANTTHKVEDFYQKNKKNINIILITIIAVVGGYIGVKKFYFEPLEFEAQNEIFKAQQLFEKDSFALALKGDEKKGIKGFEAIADEYGSTKAGNLAHYYAGICNLRTGNFAAAIEMLEGFSTNNDLVGPLATGLLGDAYVESGDIEKGAGLYMKAARMNKNKLTAPVFYKKAGIAYEELKNYDDALSAYTVIKNDYPEAQENSDIEKYIARVTSLKEGK
ncbi:MAG: tetratricopeptide repeat protein [Bacteroidia bacterium]|jgi:tetratricopeptide (TPR) repeat protein|nr:tetratricopeptide repeat protein [Bacteroidia bacterium]